jgi:hypothetical protein
MTTARCPHAADLHRDLDDPDRADRTLTGRPAFAAHAGPVLHG